MSKELIALTDDGQDTRAFMFPFHVAPITTLNLQGLSFSTRTYLPTKQRGVTAYSYSRKEGKERWTNTKRGR